MPHEGNKKRKREREEVGIRRKFERDNRKEKSEDVGEREIGVRR